MRGSYRLLKVMGIDIEIHSTFLLLLFFFFFLMGIKGFVLILGVFFFVTVHELCHSLAAAYYGIKVKKITLLPIGGVASMPKEPAKPHQELVISVAGPLSNIVMGMLLYSPLYMLLGRERLMYPFLVITGQAAGGAQFNILAHIFWINIVLAVFNMIPAFPMDGGRVLRAILSYKLGKKEATAIAVKIGHIFSLLFAYLGIVNAHIFLVIIAAFIYISASSEGRQVDLTETIKKYKVQDVLPREFMQVTPETTLSRILEITFHSHQEAYPVVGEGGLLGMITRSEIMTGLHQNGPGTSVGQVMRTDIPGVGSDTELHKVQKLMTDYSTGAMPVLNSGVLSGVVTLEDINRVYTMINERTV